MSKDIKTIRVLIDRAERNGKARQGAYVVTDDEPEDTYRLYHYGTQTATATCYAGNHISDFAVTGGSSASDRDSVTTFFNALVGHDRFTGSIAKGELTIYDTLSGNKVGSDENV